MIRVLSDRYTLLREVGRGGMGAVWQGEDEILHRPVAVKRIGFAPEQDAPDSARAEREARLAASINHPHVVSVYDLVDDAERQWLVMEYVDGGALSTLLEQEGALPLDRAAELLAQAADALAAAHAAGIVHRDIKPSNMLVGPGDQVKLTDFGIARGEADASLTRTGMVTGSPAYLAPEVASGSSATPASDVWSLGATLYHALTGHPPYDGGGDNVLGVLYKIVNEDPPRLEPGHRLAPLLEHTMALDPAERWTTAEVRDFLRGEPRAAAAEALPESSPAPSLLAAMSEPEPAARRTGAVAAQHAAPKQRAWLLPAAVVGVAVLLVAVVGFALGSLGGDDDAPDTSRPAGGALSAEPSSPSTGRSDPSPSPSPSPSTSETPEPDAAGMTSFVQGYLATVTSDPDVSWQQLTTSFKGASGGLDTYRGFWSDYASAAPRDITADPDSMTVSYTVDYVLQDGTQRTDSVTLELIFRDEEYLIAGES